MSRLPRQRYTTAQELAEALWRNESAQAVYVVETVGQLPQHPFAGEMWFVRSLGYPVWWSGSAWVDATGAEI